MRQSGALICAVVLLNAQSARAAGVVGTGTAASCTDAALDAALNGGGMVTFNCGGTVTGSSFCNTNPLLDRQGLQNNGGMTQTIALQFGSPAINAGDNDTCERGPVWSVDQRGYARPGTGSSSCAIGAFEFGSSGLGPSTPTNTPTLSPTATPTKPTLTPTPTVTPTPTLTRIRTPAGALSACAAIDIINHEAGCPPAGDCTITKQYIVANGCKLDFSGRNVTLSPTAVLTIDSGTVTLLTNDLVLAASQSSAADIDGRGTGSSWPADQGANVIIKASGDVSIEKNGNLRAGVEVSATQQAGSIQITAAGTVTAAGRLAADQEPNAARASGGEITVKADKDIITQAGSQIQAGAGSGGYGGTVDFTAGSTINLGEIVDVSGGDGGTVNLTANGDVVVRGITGSGTGIYGHGGYVDIEAGRGAQLLASPISLSGSDDQTYGGTGGTLDLNALQGDLTIAAGVVAESRGAVAGGVGSAIRISVRGNVIVTATNRLSTHGYSQFAGEILFIVGGSLTMAGTIDAGSERYEGGPVGFYVAGDATISGPIDASSGSDFARTVVVSAGGDLLISSVIAVNGYGSNIFECGSPGVTELSGRNVTLTGQAQVLARGPKSGGTNYLTADGELIVDGVLDASQNGSFPVHDFDGSNVLAFSCGTIHGTIRPPAAAVPAPCEPTPVMSRTNTAAPFDTPAATPLPTATCAVACTVEPSSTPTDTPSSESTFTPSPVLTPAAALSACSAADIINQEAGCPPAGDCTITKQYIVPDGCTLDFSGRNVTLSPTAVLTIGSGTVYRPAVKLLTRDLTLAASEASAAYIDGRGTGSSTPANDGAGIIINASGDVSIEKNGNARAGIEVSATRRTGSIQITAAGAVTVAGRLAADKEPDAAMGYGGAIDVTASADIITQAGSQIRAGGGSSASGGRIAFTAGGTIDLGDIVDVSGDYGGSVSLIAQGDVVVRGVAGSGSGGFGAEVYIEAGRGAQLLASPIYLNGSGGSRFDLNAQGDLTIAAGVLAQSTLPGAGESVIGIWVQGNVTVTPATRLSTHGYSASGGGIDLNVGGSLTMAGSIDAGAESAAGYVDIDVTGDATISGPIDISSTYSESYGVTVRAGGDLLISSVIGANGYSCDSYYCADAGYTELSGRNVTLTRQAQVLSRGPSSGGYNSVTAQGELIIDGVLDAREYGSIPSEYGGHNVLGFSCGTIHGIIRPPAEADIDDSYVPLPVPMPCEPTPVMPPTNTAAPVEAPTSTPLPTATCVLACTVEPSSTPADTPSSEPRPTPSPTLTPGALSACEAVDIINQEAGCPPAGDCTITKQYIVFDGCTLDFSGRNVTLSPSAVLTIGSGRVELLANDLILAASSSAAAYVDGRGTASGGNIIINAGGDVSIQKDGNPCAGIDVSATQEAGSIRITAAGAVSVAGRLAANTAKASAGQVTVKAGADIITQAGSQIQAGGSAVEYGRGRIEFTAGGTIDLGDSVDVSGSDGGIVKLTANGDVVVRGITGSATNAGGNGGYVNIEAGGGTQLLASPIYLNGSDDRTQGGRGGYFVLNAQQGDLTIAAGLLAENRGGESDVGGRISISVQGNVTVTAAGRVSARGSSDMGGRIALNVGGSLTMAGRIDVTGLVGGGVAIYVTGDATITGPIDASQSSSFEGSSVIVAAGGDLLISSVIEVSGICDSSQDCGGGGLTQLRGRNVTLTSQAQVLARGGGGNIVTAQGELIVDGALDARRYGSLPFEYAGYNVLAFSCGTIRGTVRPPAEAVPTPCEPTPVMSPTNTAAADASPTATPVPTATCAVACTVEPNPTATDTPPPVPTVTASRTETPLPSPTATEEVVPTATPTPTRAPTPPCTGDCTLDGEVTVDEALFMVNIALGTEALSGCPAGDSNHDGDITVDEIVAAVGNVLHNCSVQG